MFLLTTSLMHCLLLHVRGGFAFPLEYKYIRTQNYTYAQMNDNQIPESNYDWYDFAVRKSYACCHFRVCVNYTQSF